MFFFLFCFLVNAEDVVNQPSKLEMIVVDDVILRDNIPSVILRDNIPSVHCYPESKRVQICPSGHVCDSSKLECKKGSRGIRYCICPVTPLKSSVSTHRVHCDPKSKIIQVCPNGQLCSSSVLQCTEDYCICPRVGSVSPKDKEEIVVDVVLPVEKISIEIDVDVTRPMKSIPSVHCYPESKRVQICPSGHVCDSSKLECKKGSRGIRYCICPVTPLKSSVSLPTHKGHSTHMVHCDPKSKIIQVCPNGQLCSPTSLKCVKDYCLCPFGSFYSKFVDTPVAVTDVVVSEPDVHCDPYSKVSQLCPNGAVCDSGNIHCELDNYHKVLYCVCPRTSPRTSMSKEWKEVQCDPNSVVPQVCPTGQLCSSSLLQCTEDYCVCPHGLRRL